MASILIADSGSTKTDWCLLQKGKKPTYFKTSGINPYLLSEGAITDILCSELLPHLNTRGIANLFFFGAGASRKSKQAVLRRVFKSVFSVSSIEVAGDMLAAARSICGSKSGIVCILGTGSASCYYNGKVIKEQKVSLGYIAGDEGSGNHMGKRVLQYYAYNTFDTTLKEAFESMFGSDLDVIMHHLYHEPFPNRYLATFVHLLSANRGHFMVENIIEDCLNDFFHHNVLKYRQSWKMPLYFTGSVAYQFADVLHSICTQYELEIGAIEKSPIEGLAKFYKKML